MSSARSPTLLSTSISSTLNPTTTTTTSELDAPIEAPPPASSRFGRNHRRNRVAVELPPLFTNPSRSSVFLPYRSSEKSHPQTDSPPKSPTHEIDDLDFADEEGSGIRLEPKSRKLASWFNGTSEPISIGLLPSPVKEDSDPFTEESEEMDARDDNLTARALPSSSTRNLPKRPDASPASLPSASSGSRFSFFKPKALPGSSALPQMTDELVKLDISKALFPGGPTDEFSPAAFKNLQMNAEGTLRKFQTAYAEALQSLRGVTSERNVQGDELEAAQTRNEHLKLQLTAMAEKALEQETAMKQMAEELAMERQKRIEEEEFRKRTLRFVPTAEQEPLTGITNTTFRRHNRISSESSFNNSETDSESFSEAESIFSHAPTLSRTTSCASPTPSARTPEICQTDGSVQYARPTSPLKLVTLSPNSKPNIYQQECQICHGMPSSEAWDVVNVLREESKALKETISHLEAGLDSSLDFVAGLI